MNSNDQRVAIGKACGWKWVNGREWCWEKLADDGGSDPIHRALKLPDYLNDLNACRDAEKILAQNFTTQDFQRARFVKKLESIVSREGVPSDWSWALLQATAAQRCEAFLRALNLWKEEPALTTP